MVSATGAFDYLTEYTFDISRDDHQPLVLSKLIGKLVTPDNFQTLRSEAMPGIVISKMLNTDHYVQIDPQNPSKCPYIVVVYRPEITTYPWAVYSCEDLNINSEAQHPRFSAFRFKKDGYLWVERNPINPTAEQPELSVLDLSNISMITVHTVKNTTIEFKRFLNFSDISVTLKTLNGNKILKSLGLLTSSFLVPFEFIFGWSPWVWFPVMGFGMILVMYYGIAKDLMNRKIFKILFGGPDEQIPGGELGVSDRDRDSLEEQPEQKEDYEEIGDSGDYKPGKRISVKTTQNVIKSKLEQESQNQSLQSRQKAGTLEGERNETEAQNKEFKLGGLRFEFEDSDDDSSVYSGATNQSGDWVLGQRYTFEAS